MAREDTIICMDNSEWMRNGDYSRTRMEAQYQAIEHLIRVKTSHPENTVGLISLAGGQGVGVQVLCSPTTERYKVGKAAQNAKIGGRSDILTGLKVAQLALKFRPQRNIQARIIMFVGSPMNTVDETKLKSLARDLRKNNIAIDVIAVGEHEVNIEILKEFMKNSSKRDGGSNNLVVVPPGTYIEDAIQNSPMGQEGEEEMDPMLAMALAESRAMAQAQGQDVRPSPPPKSDSTSVTATAGGGHLKPTDNDEQEEEDEDEDDELLQQAKIMSMMEDNKNNQPTGDGKNIGKVLSKDFEKNLMKEAGVDLTSKEVKKELDELQQEDEKPEKKKKKKDDKNI